ncbi:hypothetical protein L484_013656 [Morus notabilis]|uniref:F-box domain-containing protein n=1 Tax=Morus notabilis TaxID=981085 RepID=W9QM62_9ROSA|nr:hypothetical protein L484_013656 [Morus notabilis]
MANFPPEIISDILCRLPVKDLLRFRSALKPSQAFYGNPIQSRPHQLVTLWNPSTRRYTNIPFPVIVSPPGFKVSQPFIYGFGYDPINGDYKLVKSDAMYSTI